MKQLISISILFLFFIHSTQSQDYIPINIDSLTQFDKVYAIIKWDDEDVEKMDSIHRPQYYEGGVLVIKKERKHINDTVYVSDVSGIDREKYEAITSKHWHLGYVKNKSIIPYPVKDNCLYLFGKTRQINKHVLSIRNERSFVGCHLQPMDFVLNEEYIQEFPSGLPQKMKIYSHSLPNVTSLTWTEWKLTEKHRTNQKLFDDFIYFDAEENICYPYPSGYYSNLVDFECKEIDLMVLKVQKALNERGYSIRVTGILNTETKAALAKFQKENGLSIHGFHLTAQYLGIED